MQLSIKEQGLLQKVITNDAHEVLQRMANQMLENWAHGSVIKDNEFLTLVETIGREERKRALAGFLSEIERSAHGN